MNRIRTIGDIEKFVDQLVRADPRLKPIQDMAGPLPLRRSEPNFDGLAEIVLSQHVSKASAAAVNQRLRAMISPMTAERLTKFSDDQLGQAGLTRPKQKTLRGIAESILNGDLNLDDVCQLPSPQAMIRLQELKGIGPWTAEVFLLLCDGRTDVFPAGDVALRTAIGHALNMNPRPSTEAVRQMAEVWGDLRGVAARLFWEYYAKVNNEK